MSMAAESLQDTAFLQGSDAAAVSPEQDTGLLALLAAARQLDVAADAGQVWHLHGKTDAAFDATDIIRCAKRMGIKARLAPLPERRLLSAPVPYLIRKADTGQWYAVTGAVGGQLQVTNPLTGGTTRNAPKMLLATLTARSSCAAGNRLGCPGKRLSGSPGFCLRSLSTKRGSGAFCWPR
ncbi:hypothetical protein [Leisingera sp. NJS201]|uniref:hypothetical protein n=1 Tax=Leisingera sp. NJS201 TaxID=2508306 RepID=UPI0020C7F6E7|nr:hypothetical protein [Leisingera sp. NJS201]